jgi:hypothetical protein
VQLDLGSQHFCVFWEAALVLIHGRPFAELFAQENLVKDKVEDNLGVGPENGVTLQVILRGDAFAGLPAALTLIDAQHPGRLVRREWTSLRQEGVGIGPLTLPPQPVGRVLPRSAVQGGSRRGA